MEERDERGENGRAGVERKREGRRGEERDEERRREREGEWIGVDGEDPGE